MCAADTYLIRMSVCRRHRCHLFVCVLQTALPSMFLCAADTALSVRAPHFRRLCPDISFFQQPTEYPCQEVVCGDYHERLHERVDRVYLSSASVRRVGLGMNKVSVLDLGGKRPVLGSFFLVKT